MIPMRRIAVIFDNTQRPETTGIYCRRALGELVGSGQIDCVEHFLPTDLNRVQPGQFDLFLFIDDGIQESLPDHLRPAAWWGIDTHINYERCLQFARPCDFVFSAQRDGVEQLRQDGIRHVQWLPLACDPAIHGRRNVDNRFDLAFVGHVFPGRRQQAIEALNAHFERFFVGQCYFEEMAEIYSASKIAFNRSIANDINMRVFEGLSSGALLLTNRLKDNGLAELLAEDVDYVAYAEIEELIDKAKYYLQHEEIREKIAQSGRNRALNQHTYRHRMESLLAHVANNRSRKSCRSNAVPTKDRTYFEFDRSDVLELVPTTASRVLDIGCGAGRLGKSIRQRQPARVTGIELDATAAELAGRVLNDVVRGDVQEAKVDFPAGEFDCVICADVLEHLESPHLVLDKIHRWLAPDGCLITSLPNVRHNTVVRNLLAGNWTYEQAGLLDSDHVRFFTRRGIEKLLFQAGFSVEQRRIVPGPGFEEWVDNGRSRNVALGELRLETASTAEAEEFFAYQYLFRSSPVKRDIPLTSIVMVTHNQLAYTQACLESLFRFTCEPFELIVVDNASSDGTAEFVESTKAQLIRNSENRGFPAAVNQGIKAATGAAVLLLNNDTLLTTGWLERLWSALRSSERIGIVGPCTNCTSGLQRVDVEYDLTTLDDFAWNWRIAHFGQVVPAMEVTGFCILIDREVIEAVGLLDERFEDGVYEDVDYCRRAIEAGFEMAVAADAFVHHFGHKSYHEGGIDQDQVAIESEAKFREKWKLRSRSASGAPSAPRTPYRTPQSLPWNSRTEWLGKIMQMGKSEFRNVLVFVREAADLRLCEKFRSSFGARVTTCTDSPRHESSFPNTDLASLTGKERCYDAVVIPRLDDTREPQTLLALAHQLLRTEGELICHSRNVQSREYIEALVRGIWPTHVGDSQLRFFTRRELEKCLFTAGFRINGWQPIHGAGYCEWRAGIGDDGVQLGSLQLRGMSDQAVENLLTSDFVIRAAKEEERDIGLTSIVIVTHNQFSYTKGCIDSIRMRTTEPYELIVVDNGSTDPSVSWLRSQPDVRLIENRENRGFPAAANQGIEAASGDNILFLNNDTVVTTGWLRRQLAALWSAPDVGLVGPVSNQVSGKQQVGLVYSALDQLDGAAWEWGREHHQQQHDTDRLVGFCLLVKREVIDRIGVFDDRFGVGNFEDDDFCRRALQAGYRAVIARDSFVHHFGSVTFRATNVNHKELLRENQRKYHEKWQADSGRQPPEAPSFSPADSTPRRPRSPWILHNSKDEGLLLQPNRTRLSLCMIVRDNERTIRPCLESIRPWVDEMVVVDTGSTDRTPQICEELGAKVFHWPWRDDFAAARNESLRHARGEWLFWMDSDDTISPDCGQRLRQLANGNHEEHVSGYVMQVHCPSLSERDVTVVDHIKMIRNRPDLRFEFRIHEQILPSIRRAGGEVAWTDVFVTHSGSDRSEQGRRRKIERDLKLLHLELRDRPDHPFVLFNLGMTHAEAGDAEQAIGFLRSCLNVSSPQESHLRKAYALLVAAQMKVDRDECARECCGEGLSRFPNDPELLFRRAMLHHRSDHLEAAAEDYRRLLEMESDQYFSSVDTGIQGYKARHNLAVILEQMGHVDDAESEWKTILRQHPTYEPARLALERLNNREVILK